MANVVARIKLAPGETGFYNEPNGIYLNWDHPIADVTTKADFKSLRKAVKDKHIIVLDGTLGTSKTFKQILMEAKSKRTGIPLKELMGNTPLAFDPTEAISDVSDGKKAATDAPETVIDVPQEEKPSKTTENENPSPSKEVSKAEEVDTPVELEEVIATSKTVNKKPALKATLAEEPADNEPAKEEVEAKAEEEADAKEEVEVKAEEDTETKTEETVEKAPAKKKTTRKKSTKKAEEETTAE